MCVSISLEPTGGGHFGRAGRCCEHSQVIGPSIAAAAAIALAYLLSSVSFPWLVARLYGVDLQRVGSRKLGGSNLVKSVGVVPGVAGGLLDAAKSLAAVLIARALGLPLEVQLACGLAANVGQMWPIFHGFDGGRANATGWGFALASDPVAALIMGAPLAAALVLGALVRPRPTRLFPLASLLSFFVFPAVIWEQDGITPTVVAGLGLVGLILVRRVTAGLREDLRTGAPLSRVLANRALYDRSELQERGLVGI
jgi:glycerol-3-phosphate acyltransferase PlsY